MSNKEIELLMEKVKVNKKIVHYKKAPYLEKSCIVCRYWDEWLGDMCYLLNDKIKRNHTCNAWEQISKEE